MGGQLSLGIGRESEQVEAPTRPSKMFHVAMNAKKRVRCVTSLVGAFVVVALDSSESG
jgi:hypothetical protein